LEPATNNRTSCIPMCDASNGVLTALTKTTVDGICQ
jgi:hypothetical protein